MYFRPSTKVQKYSYDSALLFTLGLIIGVAIEYTIRLVGYIPVEDYYKRKIKGFLGFIISVVVLFTFIQKKEKYSSGTEVFFITGLFNVQLFTQRLLT
jgi:hypothetical protein